MCERERGVLFACVCESEGCKCVCEREWEGMCVLGEREMCGGWEG